MAVRLGAAIVACGLAVTPVSAADPAMVERFAALADAFSARLPRSPLEGLAPASRRDRADCILTNFETAHGASGLSALMSMMSVLASGAQFDDQTIVDFNARFGPDYDRIEMECTRAQRGS
ncbi:hypothetical protein HMH01_04470 [Halovulum dunhuangense]|uniref:Uncharacterized protein n=1 Tax=Halovulum dunhuangense TaxID=1505036 RepID=A0A849L0A1_9RHOB|nr:hypothetical protein [Halovulum dunhuangense]NNU79690.1 hypothetical protein [Halovulum dunhuangense]